MRKKYNTPHRRHVVKTCMTDEEYADFTGRLAAYEISQSEFIRQAIWKTTIRPIVTVSPINDGLIIRRLQCMQCHSVSTWQHGYSLELSSPARLPRI